ncbi:MAG: D-alanyl-D-alanine carboxypeptidase/D-alanyl-D-alanine-endopeptidase [Melioribacteraceae bacterium]|nr:D-alanyl-D-alanine carboxypeptidase/D-alanyl-D-alanine-endopeptidase [Melioribacteraceae bacterium]
MWGVSIQSLQNGETLYKLNQDKLFLPASLMKIFTSSTALLLLGSDYNYTTEFYSDGKIVDGILDGNLYIVGSGDPSIYANMKNQRNIFSEWTVSLKQLGITGIRGNLIGDDRHYETDNRLPGWLAEYENNWFAQPSGAFCLNNNSIVINVKPTQVRHPADHSVFPSNNSYEILNKVITVGDKEKSEIEIIHKPGSNLVILSGKISVLDDNKRTFIPTKDPTHFFTNTLYNYLIENDIEINGHAADVEIDDMTEVESALQFCLKRI